MGLRASLDAAVKTEIAAPVRNPTTIAQSPRSYPVNMIDEL